MSSNKWYLYENGATINQIGSEEGTIIIDEEHSLGARIALEENAKNAPYAITCGIYGWMFHTCYISSRKDAIDQFNKMKEFLHRILEMRDQYWNDQASTNNDYERIIAEITEFVDQYMHK